MVIYATYATYAFLWLAPGWTSHQLQVCLEVINQLRLGRRPQRPRQTSSFPIGIGWGLEMVGKQQSFPLTKVAEMIGNGWKWFEMVGNGWKWLQNTKTSSANPNTVHIIHIQHGKLGCPPPKVPSQRKVSHRQPPKFHGLSSCSFYTLNKFIWLVVYLPL